MDFLDPFGMALYHKWYVKNGFAYVLQFFSLISDGLGGVWPVVFACQLSISVGLQMSPLVLFVDLWVQRQEGSTAADKLLVFLLLCPHQLTLPSTTYLL